MCLIKLKARQGGHDGENKSSAAAAATVKFARFSDFYVLIVHSGWCAREEDATSNSKTWWWKVVNYICSTDEHNIASNSHGKWFFDEVNGGISLVFSSSFFSGWTCSPLVHFFCCCCCHIINRMCVRASATEWVRMCIEKFSLSHQVPNFCSTFDARHVPHHLSLARSSFTLSRQP